MFKEDYSRDLELFNCKIAPLIGLNEGTHIRITKHKCQEIKNGKIFDTKMTIYELSQKAQFEVPAVGALYDKLFSELSGHVHVNVLVSEKYFSKNDPYFEFDEDLLAGLLGIFFTLVQLCEMASNDFLELNLKKDILYLSNMLSEKMLEIISLLELVEDDSLFEHIKELLNFYDSRQTSII